jgi:hypothetical protein
MLGKSIGVLLVAILGVGSVLQASAAGGSYYAGRGPGTLVTDFSAGCGSVTVTLAIRSVGPPADGVWEFRELEVDPTCVVSHSEWTAVGSPQVGWHFHREQTCITIDITVGPLSDHTSYVDAIESRCDGNPTHRTVTATLDFGPFV